MHLHHFTLRALAAELNQSLPGSRLVDCFSQSKDELVLEFEKGEDAHHLRISCHSSFPFITPVHSFRRARKNLVSLFPDFAGQEVRAVEAPEWERLLVIHFTTGDALAAKMHGMQSNVIALRNGAVHSLFRTALKADEQFTLSAGPFDKDWKAKVTEPVTDVAAALKNISPVLDKHFAQRVKQQMEKGHGFSQALTQVLALAGDRTYHLSVQAQRLQFLLFPDASRSVAIDGVGAALQAFVRSRFLFEKYGQLYTQLAQPLAKQIKKLRDLVLSAQKGIRAIEEGRNPEEVGNLLMAQLHLMRKGTPEVELDDYYLGGKLKITLRPDLDPQQNATLWYGKAKKQKARLGHLHSQLKENESRLAALLPLQTEFDHFPLPGELPLLSDGIDPRPLRELEAFAAAHEKLIAGGGSAEEASRRHPFHEFTREGYSIFVGRNARQNDELTFHFSRREDLWLHVKDSPGSHVIVRLRPGREFPGSVIEFAASLAAGYSPRKTEGLVPVIYTARKFVRKPKGAAAGLVVVDKEEVVLVEPLNRE